MRWCFQQHMGAVVVLYSAALTGFGGAALAQLKPPPDNRYFDVAQYQPRGVLKATRSAAFATRIVASVSVLNIQEGQTFRKGDILLSFDCRQQRAEMKSRQATVREMQLTLKSNAYLARRAAAGRQDVEISRARLQKAEAELEAIQAEVSNCNVIAPFDGAVSDLQIKMHELPVSGQPFLSIVSNHELEAVAIVPSRWLRWLKVGLHYSYRIDELGLDVEVEIIRLGQVIDPVSQTLKIFGRPLGRIDDLKAGMSGSADFSRHLVTAVRAR